MTKPGLSAEQLYAACRDLASFIAKARREISSIRPSDLQDNKIPLAGKELDAIVEHTEAATNSIMDNAEVIMGLAGEKAEVTDACMAIFDACAFQDITGQRISKVITTLNTIEERLQGLQKAWGPDLNSMPQEVEDVISGDKALLNGPQLPGQGVSQDEVDDMFN